ncbi:MAG: cation diffusion facilitator family transporter [Enterobacterales bacterium]|nr:cation diffusion facilitator family transporter [Enterobacterales bacterium]
MAKVNEQHKKLLRAASIASVITASGLLLLKLVGYWLTDSVSMLASLLDSMLDIVASVINLIAIRIALTPPDKEHPFGHGKAEALAGLGQATFIAGSACFLMIQAINSLNDPQSLSDKPLDVGILIMLVSMLATSGLIIFQRYVHKVTRSIAIKADSMHYLTDLLSNALVIAALLFVYWGVPWMDPLMAIVIGVYILYSAWQIVSESVHMLLDRELDDAIQDDIRRLVFEDPDVQAIHELRTRESGHTQFIQLHIEMDGSMTLHKAHDVSDRIMHRLEEVYPAAEILIHQDPYNDAPDQNLRITTPSEPE